MFTSNCLDPIIIDPAMNWVGQSNEGFAGFYSVDNDTTSTYITKQFSLGSTATSLKVNFDALVPTGNHIMVYGKFDTSSTWTKLNTPNILRSGDYESLSYGFEKTFNTVKIKILFKGTNTVEVPKVVESITREIFLKSFPVSTSSPSAPVRVVRIIT